jgi:hypothetical protein
MLYSWQSGIQPFCSMYVFLLQAKAILFANFILILDCMFLLLLLSETYPDDLFLGCEFFS